MREIDATCTGSSITYKCPDCRKRHTHGYGGPNDLLIRWSHCPVNNFESIHLNITEECSLHGRRVQR